jgi:hypothetical protein
MVEHEDFVEEQPSALAWLRGRGLTDEYIGKYYFGYVNEGYYADSVSIPVLDGLTQYVATRFRRLTGTPKYDRPKGEKAHLFNVSSVRHRVVHLAEGEFDATILEQVGRHAVGVPGIHNFREEWRWLFAGNEVRIVFDHDEPGTEAFKQTRQAIGQIKRWIEPVADDFLVVELPVGHDVGTLYLEDPDALAEVLKQYDR